MRLHIDSSSVVCCHFKSYCFLLLMSLYGRNDCIVQVKYFLRMKSSMFIVFYFEYIDCSEGIILCLLCVCIYILN